MSLPTLPPELRQQIYSYLISSIPHSYFPSRHHFVVTSFSHKPPPSALQRACCFLYNDIMAHFYTVATVIFLAWVTPESSCHFTIYDLRAIRRARKVEIRIVWKGPAQRWGLYPSLRSTCTEYIVGWLKEEANDLVEVTVNMLDPYDIGLGWNVRAAAMAPLRLLKGRVKFVAGGHRWKGDGPLRKRLEAYVMELNDSRP